MSYQRSAQGQPQMGHLNHIQIISGLLPLCSTCMDKYPAEMISMQALRQRIARFTQTSAASDPAVSYQRAAQGQAAARILQQTIRSVRCDLLCISRFFTALQ